MVEQNTKLDYTTEYPARPRERNNIPLLVVWLTMLTCGVGAWQLWSSYVHWLVWLLFLSLFLSIITATAALNVVMVAKAASYVLPIYEQWRGQTTLTTLAHPFMSPPPPPSLATKKPVGLIGEAHEKV